MVTIDPKDYPRLNQEAHEKQMQAIASVGLEIRSTVLDDPDKTHSRDQMLSMLDDLRAAATMRNDWDVVSHLIDAMEALKGK